MSSKCLTQFHLRFCRLQIRVIHTSAIRRSPKVNFNNGLRKHLQRVLADHKTLVDALSSQEVCKMSSVEHRKLTRAVTSLQPLANLAVQHERKEKELNELNLLTSSTSDADLKKMAREDITHCIQEIERLQNAMVSALVPKDPSDDSNVVLEVRCGAGGDEAALFTGEIFHMYQRFASHKGWEFEPLSCHRNGIGGLKEATASIIGEEVYKVLKHEKGVHRIQRVPLTESLGRVHTSTMSVVVLPQPEEIEVEIDQKDLRIETMRASGAGGQYVNTTDSAVRMTHIPTGISVHIQDERSQHKNKSKALKLVKAKLYDIQSRKVQEERSTERRQQIGTAERSERIRTYNFPQDRVTDHRLGITVHGIEDFMTGSDSLDNMIENLIKMEEENHLEELVRQNR